MIGGSDQHTVPQGEGLAGEGFAAVEGGGKVAYDGFVDAERLQERIEDIVAMGHGAERIDPDASVGGVDQRGTDRFEPTIGDVLQQADVPHGTVECVSVRRIQFREEGQELVSDAVATNGRVAVAAIFAPGGADGTHIRFDFLAGHAQQRTKQRDVGSGNDRLSLHAAQSPPPAGTHEVQQEGFAPVIGLMRDGYASKTFGAAKVGEPAVTQFPGGHFQADALLGGIGGRVEVLGIKSDAVPPGPVGHKIGIGVGIGSPKMEITVCNRKILPGPDGFFGQTHRIDAAANRQQDPLHGYFFFEAKVYVKPNWRASENWMSRRPSGWSSSTMSTVSS